ncbi:S1C family serine protease [Salsuginibacillus kocurii]|uniref:S1C family serine protease n=1 Tax=Salsuginibacillus kocurii TaxID=427078 RepID=UPI00035F2F09|nr:trypsin-like peptidase domain-containing protein [Salsuginibacillus kocurii]
MGYYDNHMDDRQNRRNNKRSGSGAGLYGFLGALVGAGAVLLFMSLGGNGLFSAVTDTSEENQEMEQVVEEGEQQEQHEEDTPTETVDVDVNTDISRAVEEVSDSVVGVFNLQETDFWAEEGTSAGNGSGVIYKVDGEEAYIVTNQHVIEGANQVEVSMGEGLRVEAEVLGEDVLTDLAVLRIDADEVDTVAEFGNSENLSSGEPAIAIGNPLGPQFARTVTQGIISSTERSLPIDMTGDGQIDWHAEVLQTDAAINPGNSGGALVNINGEVIGINSMKIAQSAVEGIGFAIPTSIAVPVIEDLEQHGEVRRPELGVAINSLSEIPSYHWQETLMLPEEVESGVFVVDVVTNSAADQAGLEEYDVITEINGVAIHDGHDLRQYLYTEAEIGQTIEVTFYREGEQHSISVDLQEGEQL